MVAFILPLKPKTQSKNWESDCSLLYSTIKSLLNQRSSNYKIFVVFTDEPTIKNPSQKVIWVKFPYPFISFNDIPDAAIILPHFKNDKIMLERRWDKSKKIFYGCKQAKEQGCTYLMSVDADDLVSNRLLPYIMGRISEENIPGFYISKGYLLRRGAQRMISIDEGMQNFNGSTHILKADYVPIPDFENGTWLDFNLFTSHGWLLSRVKELYGIELEKIPFAAIIYIAHGGNISKVSSKTFSQTVKHFIKLVLKGRAITQHLKNEFAIP